MADSSARNWDCLVRIDACWAASAPAAPFARSSMTRNHFWLMSLQTFASVSAASLPTSRAASAPC
ncbi:hypothetical protein CU254_25970 [Amycolatopsis sp. AA4]|nr:hypothetical protein CU254_25970 [Amycolatopsis sp. AA4]